MHFNGAMLVNLAERLVADDCSAADRWQASLVVMMFAGDEAMIARRDAALRRAATLLAADLPAPQQVRTVGVEICRYRDRWLATDRHLTAMPAAYVGTARAALFEAYRFGDGDVPNSRRSLGRILASR